MKSSIERRHPGDAFTELIWRESQRPLIVCVAKLSVSSVYSLWIVLRKRVGIRPLLLDKLSSILIPQDGAIAPEGFVLLPIVDPFINKRINYQYDDQLPI